MPTLPKRCLCAIPEAQKMTSIATVQPRNRPPAFHFNKAAIHQETK
jgi:hypothetical protein